MSNGAQFDYCFENKTIWRRRVWDAIHHRLSVNGVRPRNAVGLYLAGEKNLDASVAAEHGFDRNNMIAVEWDGGVAEALRKDGVLTFKGNLFSAMNGWSPNVPCHFIVADFCCGLVESTAQDFAIFLSINNALSDTIVAANFLRGRDAFSNVFRSLFAEDYKESAKHRGETFIHILLMMLENNREKSGTPINQEELSKIISSLKRRLFSYKSTSGQVFDSVVFNNVFPAFRSLGDTTAPSTSGQMAALLATRTRRMKSELTRCPVVNAA